MNKNKIVNKSAPNTFCFLEDILVVSLVNETGHENIDEEVMKNLGEENFSLVVTNFELFKDEADWLRHN